MNLAAVDIGNTYIKICQWQPKEYWSSLKIGVSEAVEECLRRGVSQVAFCSSRRLEDHEKKLLDQVGWWEFQYGINLPIAIAYATPETLGPDRLAAAIGAWTEYPGKTVLVVDSGTALTLDVMDGQGIFLGGNISPGLKMRLDSLHEHTSRLPRVDNVMEISDYLGRDTRTAIMAGCRFGLAYEVDGAFRMARRERGCETVLVTGGHGALLMADLERISRGRYPVRYIPELVAVGLKTAYEFNHD